jgi:hypothetical protein
LGERVEAVAQRPDGGVVRGGVEAELDGDLDRLS